MHPRRLLSLLLVPVSSVAILVSSAAAIASGGSCDTDFTEILQRQSSGVTVEQYRVIDNVDDWCDFWDEVHGIIFPAPECPVDVVDFATEVVLAAAIGSRPNGCYGVDISCINKRGQSDDLRVTVTETVPGPACACTQATVNPVDAVAVQRPVGNVDFFKKTAKLDCR